MNEAAFVPPSSRPFFGNGRENYAHQLGIVELPEIHSGSIRLLDIGGGNSSAIPSLLPRYQNAVVTLLDQSYDANEHQDNQKVQKKRVDLDNLDNVREVLSQGQFDLIFMNQVLQYVRDPFGLIAYIFENHLQISGHLYCNISCNIFEHGSSVAPYQLFSIMEDRWEKEGILVESNTWNNMKQFHFHKKDADCKMKTPEFMGFTEIGSQGFRRQKYSFRNYVEE